MKTQQHLKLSASLVTKLDRLTTLNSLLNVSDGEGDQDTKEHTALSQELSEVFIPVVRRLVAAGLLDITVDVEDPNLLADPELAMIIGHPFRVFSLPEGRICIASRCCDGIDHEPESKPHLIQAPVVSTQQMN
jgi:hypothetical protein